MFEKEKFEDKVGRSMAVYASWLSIAGINLVAFGLELCSSAGFTYISPLLLKNEFTQVSLIIIMGIGPFISLLIVPVIGHWSDRCFSQFGRRRPFIFVLGFLMLLSLLIIPFNKEISRYSFGILDDVFILVVGIILLDFSSQALMNPAKALIPDLLKTNEEQNSGFTIYSCMLSLGGCVGYLISSVNWAETSIGYSFGGQEKTVFSLLASLFLFLLIINLNLAKEIPLQRKQPENSYLEDDVHTASCKGKDVQFDKDCQTFQISVTIFPKCDKADCSKFQKFLNAFQSWKFDTNICAKCIYCCISLPINLVLTVKFNISRYLNMPPFLSNLFISNLFGWMGIMCHDLYYTDFVGQVIYAGKPQAIGETTSFNLYNEGIRMGSWGLLLHCLSAAIYTAFIQEALIIKFGQHPVYLFGLMLFSLCLLGTVLTKSILLVNLFAVLSGTGLAVITTIPYLLVSKYYTSEKCHQPEDRGIGEDLAVLDSAFYLSQILSSVFLGLLMNLTGSPSIYMLFAAFCGIASSLYSFFTQFGVSNFTGSN